LTEQAELSPELKAAFILFFSLVDEQQWRLYAGLESHKMGHGGDRKVAEFFGLDVHTVARGRRELFGEQVQRQRVRKKGNGRKRTAPPEVIEHIADLLKHDKAGDPVHGLKWTGKTTRKIARQLRRLNIRISASTGGRLLKKMDSRCTSIAQEAGMWEQEPAPATSAASAARVDSSTGTKRDFPNFDWRITRTQF